MVRTKICCVSEGIVIDKETNSASIFSVVEGIGAAAFPLFIQKTAFFCLWERDMEDPQVHHGEFTIRIGDQVLVHSTDIVVDFLNQPRNRTVIRLNGLVVPNPGRLFFRLSLQGQGVAECIIEVNINEPVEHIAG